jgi:hypothetical protein
VPDDEDLLGAEEVVGDDERADRVVARQAAGIAALRMTCASPSSSPSARAGSMRASMHVRTAKRRAGGIARAPLSKSVA